MSCQRHVYLKMSRSENSDNPKARYPRGLKHIKNKRKYKPGGHAAPPKPKPQPVLDSNWDRYEQEGPENRIGTDFAILASAPITHGSHFQFKSDKGGTDEIGFDKSVSLFNLDLKLLEQSLATIPFCMRSGIEDKYFTENQHRFMASKAKTNSDNYKSCMEIHFSKKLEPVFTDSENEPEISQSKENSNETTTISTKTQDELFQEDHTSNANTSQVSLENPEKDLEQWLDDILDD